MNSETRRTFLATHPRGSAADYAHWLRIRKELINL